MLRRVPTATSLLRGTIAVSTTSPACRTNFTWLPRRPASRNPAVSSRRLTSRKGRGLSRPNLNLDGADFRRSTGRRRLKMKFQRFFQIGESFLFRLTLTGDVDIETLGNVPLALSPYRCRKWAFHSGILSHPSYCSSVPVSGSIFASSGGITTAAATRSPSSRFNSLTPCVERPAARTVLVSIRMILPY